MASSARGEEEVNAARPGAVTNGGSSPSGGSAAPEEEIAPMIIGKEQEPASSSNLYQVRAEPKLPKEPLLFGMSLKYVSLVALTLQTSGQVMLIKWAQTAEGPKYLSSTVVCFTEVLKTVVSILLVIHESGSIQTGLDTLRGHFTQDHAELLKAAVPSLIYTVQNNLMFYSLSKLSGAVQQVLYQMKTLTTAGLSVIMLGTVLSKTRWIALVLLVSGIALVQWPRRDDEVAMPGSMSDKSLGFLAVVAACFTSGFAGVFIQKMLQQTTASIWVRNVQLGLFGSVMGFAVAMAKDGSSIMEGGLCQGYNFRVICVIMMNALGGLLCAVMLKYAGATLGCFSTALSIVLTCVCSATIQKDFVLDQQFVVGTTLTVWATMLYGMGVPSWIMSLVGHPGLK